MNIALLHLSDMHFTNAVPSTHITKLVSDIVLSTAPRLIDVDTVFIAVTGDIAFSGKVDEYEKAKSFFLKLRDSLSDETKRSVYIVAVPGNHDCDLEMSDSIRDTLIENIAKDIDSAIFEKINVVQKEYEQFDAFVTDTPDTKLDGVGYVQKIFNINGEKILFNLINTAWMTKNGQRQGTIRIPFRVFPDQQGAMEKSHIVVTMQHHAQSWINHSDIRRVMTEIGDNSDLLLTGHEHVSASHTKIGHDTSRLDCIEGGALPATGMFVGEFNLICVNTVSETMEIINFYYKESLCAEG